MALVFRFLLVLRGNTGRCSLTGLWPCWRVLGRGLTRGTGGLDFQVIPILHPGRRRRSAAHPLGWPVSTYREKIEEAGIGGEEKAATGGEEERRAAPTRRRRRRGWSRRHWRR
jgi:hypothetical protein